MKQPKNNTFSMLWQNAPLQRKNTDFKMLSHNAVQAKSVKSKRFIMIYNRDTKPISPKLNDYRVYSDKNGSAERITVRYQGKDVGSVELIPKGQQKAEIVNLHVDPLHRKKNLGQKLVKSAINSAKRIGKSIVSLQSQDDGSGKLTRWYESMGFVRKGIGSNGYIALETYV